jgi:hypothetical protein
MAYHVKNILGLTPHGSPESNTLKFSAVWNIMSIIDGRIAKAESEKFGRWFRLQCVKLVVWVGVPEAKGGGECLLLKEVVLF